MPRNLDLSWLFPPFLLWGLQRSCVLPLCHSSSAGCPVLGPKLNPWPELVSARSFHYKGTDFHHLSLCNWQPAGWSWRPCCLFQPFSSALCRSLPEPVINWWLQNCGFLIVLFAPVVIRWHLSVRFPPPPISLEYHYLFSFWCSNDLRTWVGGGEWNPFRLVPVSFWHAPPQSLSTSLFLVSTSDSPWPFPSDL